MRSDLAALFTAAMLAGSVGGLQILGRAPNRLSQPALGRLL